MTFELPLPIPVKKALRKLGHDIRTARIRRRITMELMSQRASMSRTTLTKIEKGDPSVSFGAYATVIFILGLLPNLASLCEITKDELGRVLEEENLPQRVRHPSRRPSKESQHE
jgi:transcriptional regulator with XRE-family HTH domain